ncbi:Crp/Fnr family transcriptional regulator [soil metagenome]
MNNTFLNQPPKGNQMENANLTRSIVNKTPSSFSAVLSNGMHPPVPVKRLPQAPAPIPLSLFNFEKHAPKQNHLLASLPDAEYQKLLPYLELEQMPANKVLFEVNSDLQYVYFLADSIVSLQYETQDGASAETAVIGREGLVGVTGLMSDRPSQCRAIVKSAGYGYRMKASVLSVAFFRSPLLQKVLLRYTQALMLQVSQMAVCNRHHSVVQQLCRLLLLSLDRSTGSELFMKQEAIAAMLGVRRESVTAAAAKLQDEGLIRYQRGHITICNRAGLEKRVCECYAVVKKEYDLLPCSCAH